MYIKRCGNYIEEGITLTCIKENGSFQSVCLPMYNGKRDGFGAEHQSLKGARMYNVNENIKKIC